MKRTKINTSKNTFTKKMVKFLIAVAIIDLQLTYILAFLGSPETLQDTSGKLVTEILGVVLVYCVKSFFETREEEKIRIEEEKLSCLDVYGDLDKEIISDSSNYNRDNIRYY